MAQIALEDEGKIEGNNSDRRHSDEHGLEVLGTNIRDIRDRLAIRHGGVDGVPFRAPIHQHCDQHGHPAYRAEDGYNPKRCHQHDD